MRHPVMNATDMSGRRYSGKCCNTASNSERSKNLVPGIVFGKHREVRAVQNLARDLGQRESPLEGRELAIDSAGGSSYRLPVRYVCRAAIGGYIQRAALGAEVTFEVGQGVCDAFERAPAIGSIVIEQHCRQILQRSFFRIGPDQSSLTHLCKPSIAEPARVGNLGLNRSTRDRAGRGSGTGSTRPATPSLCPYC